MSTLGALLRDQRRDPVSDTISEALAPLRLVRSDASGILFSTDPGAEAKHKPQGGPQAAFLASDADIVIYGGAAGGGKSHALLMEPLKDVDTGSFGAVIFRRTSKQVTNEGGLWDKAGELYPDFGAAPNQTRLEWNFPSGARISFAHLEHEKNKYDWQGAEVACFGFDELTHFTESQFWYMLSRNRSMADVRKRVRATTNPDADSWVADLIAWWIEQDEGSANYGKAVPERAGVVRWFIRINGELVWAGSPEELRKAYPEEEPKSLTFIPARLEDNRKLQEKDPGYRANLRAMPLVERERLEGGNWKIRGEAGKYFNELWFSPERFMDRPPRQGVKARVRYWDKAGTEGGLGARSAGVLLSLLHDGRFVVEDAVYGRWGSLEREQKIKLTAQTDPPGTVVWVEQEPGSGGKESAQTTVRNLAGHEIRVDHVHDPKHVRWGPWSAQVEGGNVWLVRDDGWNREYIKEHHNADPDKDVTVDMVDASSGALGKLVNAPRTVPRRGSQQYFSR